MEKSDLGIKFPRIQVMESGGKKTVLLSGQTYMSWVEEDRISPRIAIVQLYQSGSFNQEELAEAFDVHINTIGNYISAFNADGVEGLLERARGPKQPWKLIPRLKAEILRAVLVEGVSTYTDIQKRLKRKGQEVSLESVRQVLIENGLVEEGVVIEDFQGELFEESEKEDNRQLEIPFTCEEESKGQITPSGQDIISANPEQRVKTFDLESIGLNSKKKNRSHYSPAERMYLDLLKRGEYSAYAGGMLYLPLLERYNFLSIIDKVIKIEKENDYTLSQLCLALFFYNIFGFRSIENFKTVYSEEFGPLIGKTSGPSIYTLRRFFQDIERLNQGERLIEEFARWYLKNGLAEWGVVYVDEHFVPYYGQEIVSMGFFSVRNMPLKGSYHFFVSDEKFDPILFLLRPSSEDLIPKIPEVIKKLREAARSIGIEDEEIKDLTVVFDRGGYSGDLFRLLDEGHQELEEEKDLEIKVKFITWAKYADKWVDEIDEEKFSQCTEVRYEVERPEKIKYFEDKRKMNKFGEIRTIIIQSGRKKKRTAIYTNAPVEVPAEEIIRLMYRRWGEEDFIKALKLNYLIDYSPGFITEEIEEQPLVENPEVTKLRQNKASLEAKLQRLKAEIGDKVLSSWGKINWEELKEKQKEVLGEIILSDQEKLSIHEKINQLSKEIPYDQAHEGKRMVKFNYERKRFLDCLKVFTYAMDKKMCEILVNYHDRKDVWPTLARIVRRGGYVKLEGDKLYVRLRRFKNPLIDYAARSLCEELNKIGPFTLDKFHFSVDYQVL